MAFPIPYWLDMTPEAMKRGRWEQKVMVWLFRTQPPERAKLVILGYMEGHRETFELAASRMKALEPPQARQSRGWRRGVFKVVEPEPPRWVTD